MIRSDWQSQFRPRDTRRIYDWAREKVQLFPPLTKTGAFDITDTRHFLGPFHALQDDHVREVNVRAPVRDGKTLIADVWLAWLIVNDPGAFLGIFQVDDIAKEHCETRTWPILESIPEIAAKLPANARTQEILFTDHNPAYIWGPAISNLQSKGFRYIWLDESWMYDKGTITEAKGRLGDFVKLGIDKLLCTSQGGYAYDLSKNRNKDWHEQFSSGELNQWWVQCRHCGQHHWPAWRGRSRTQHNTGIVFDEIRNEAGFWLIDQVKETARYVCPLCQAAEPVAECARVQAAWNATGKYEIVGEKKRVKKSFTWNGLITYPWLYLIELYLTARNAARMGDHTHYTIFVQKRLADDVDHTAAEEFTMLPTIGADELPGSAAVSPADGSESPIKKWWSRQRWIFMSIDVQETHFWILIIAFSETGEFLVLHFAKVYSWGECYDAQTKYGVPDEDVMVDCGDDQVKVWYESVMHGHWAEQNGRRRWFCWIALRGSEIVNFPHEIKSGKLKGRTVRLPYSETQAGDPCINLANDDPKRKAAAGRQCPVITWSNPTIKDVAKNLRDMMAKGTRGHLAPGEWNEEFCKQMYAESKRPVPNKMGYVTMRWMKIGKRDNHGWDCFCMIIVRAFTRRLLTPPNPEEDGPAPLPHTSGPPPH